MGSSSGVCKRLLAEEEPEESPPRKSPRGLGPPAVEDPDASSSAEEGEEESDEDRLHVSYLKKKGDTHVAASVESIFKSLSRGLFNLYTIHLSLIHI